MPPKKAAENVEVNWRPIIENAVLNDSTIQIMVVMIDSAGSDQDRIYLTKFEQFAVMEKRFVIKNISKTETIFMISQLGAEKKDKDYKQRVFEEAYEYLKAKTDVPSDIMALIIKHLIVTLKEEYHFIQAQRLEVKEGILRESALLAQNTEIRNKDAAVAKQEPPPTTTPTPTPKGKSPVTTPAPDTNKKESKKYNTDLRERGEEWRDRIYCDDFPTEGPNVYVAVTGFTDAALPLWLLQYGVPLQAVVQIRIDVSISKVPSTLFRTTKRGVSVTELLYEKSLKYWKNLQKLRVNALTTDKLKQLAFLIFQPPYLNIETMSGQPDKIYDEISYLLYDIQDLVRQHNTYLNDVEVLHIETDENEDKYYKFYSRLMDDIPFECVTIYSLLDSILQTVDKSEHFDEVSSSVSDKNAIEPQSVHLTKEENLIKDIFDMLCKADKQTKTFRVTYGEEYENHRDPFIINNGNIAKCKTFHLGNINLNNIILNSLKKMPIYNLWNQHSAPHEIFKTKTDYHKNLLFSCFERNVESSDIKRMIQILSCRKLYNNRSSLSKNIDLKTTLTELKKTYLKRSIFAAPLPLCSSISRIKSAESEPSPYFNKFENSNTTLLEEDELFKIKYIFEYPDISELVTGSEIMNDKPIAHFIDDFEYFENFDGIAASQVLLDASNTFNCLDYSYSPVTDTFAMMFYNSYDKIGINRETWRNHIGTPVCLEDFFDYVLEEVYDWVCMKEKEYDQAMLAKKQALIFSENEDLLKDLCTETEKVGDFLIEGSIKHEMYLKQIEDEKNERLDQSSYATDAFTSSKNSSPQSSKKTFTKQHFSATQQEAEPEIKKVFNAYDLTDRRCEAFGKKETFFSKDGTQISSNYLLIIPENFESISLNVIFSSNNIWIHRIMGSDITDDQKKVTKSFRVVTKNEIMINIVLRSYTVAEIEPEPAPVEVAPAKPKKGGKPGGGKQKEPDTKVEAVIGPKDPPEIKPFHAFYITWPNGLVVESIHEEHSHNLSYIKVTNLQNNLSTDEDMRCVTMKGEIIIIHSLGNIEYIKPDGSYINITKYMKRYIPTPDDEDVLKVYKKKKEKMAKKAKAEDEAPEPEKKREAEIFISEFEIIDCYAHRMKYMTDELMHIEKIVTRFAVDYCLGEIFTRRNDGTNSLLNKDGVLTVIWPDGTRIASHFTIDENEVFPEWTEEELDLFGLESEAQNSYSRSKSSITTKSSNKSRISEPKSIDSGSRSMISTTTKKNLEEECRDKIPRDDGYLIISLIYVIEHNKFPTITVDGPQGKITVESPENVSVTLNCADNTYSIGTDKSSVVKFDGEILHIDIEECDKCGSESVLDIFMNAGEEIPGQEEEVEQDIPVWLKHKDTFCKKIAIDTEGVITIMDDVYSKENFDERDDVPYDDIIKKQNDTHESSKQALVDRHTNDSPIGEIDFENTENFKNKSEGSFISHLQCTALNVQERMRFFVLNRDLTCSELLHRDMVDKYTGECCLEPWCSVRAHNIFHDERKLINIAAPIYLNETEKWTMETKLATTPTYLSYKDLQKECAKGFYHWMRPYKKFEPIPIKLPSAIPPRTPRAFLFRSIEQQWPKSKRDLLAGCKELVYAILKYRAMIELSLNEIIDIPLRDPRPHQKRDRDLLLQAIAHKFYEELKEKMLEDITARSKLDITTKPLSPGLYEEAIEGEEESIDLEPFIDKVDPCKIVTEEFQRIEHPSPNLLAYWRKRESEFKQEEFYKHLLRDGTVPPYFHNVLGGAIWWDVYQLSNMAVLNSDRKRIGCTCNARGDGEVISLPIEEGEENT